MWKDKVKVRLQMWRQNKKLMRTCRKLLVCVIVLIVYTVVNVLHIEGIPGIVLRGILLGVLLYILQSLYRKN